jgi:hypothetical protein
MKLPKENTHLMFYIMPDKSKFYLQSKFQMKNKELIFNIFLFEK